jgi:hypothetical protein
MKTKTVLLTSALAFAAGTALYQFNQAQEAEVLLAVANRDRDALRERLRGDQPGALRLGGDGMLTPVWTATAGQPAQAIAATTSGNSRTPPVLAKISYATGQRIRSLDSQYRPLYRVLGLTAEQSAKFKAVMVENARRNEALMTAALEENPKMEPAVQRAIDDQTNAELVAAIRGEFGEAAVQAMEQHERTLPFRDPMDEFAKTLFYTDSPLMASQAEQLLDAVVRHERATQGKVDFDWMVQPDLYGAMLTQSAGILSAAQIEALRKVTEQSLDQKRAVAKKTVKRVTDQTIQFSPVGGTTRPGS